MKKFFETFQSEAAGSGKRKMHKIQFCDLKCCFRCVLLYGSCGTHNVCPSQKGDNKTTSCINIKTSFLQASDQKTPALNEKSRAVRMCLNEFEAHSVCMLFSGAGVPLIGMFQSVAFFCWR